MPHPSDQGSVVAQVLARRPLLLATALRIGAVIAVGFASTSAVPTIANATAPSLAVMAADPEPDLASVKLLFLGRAGVDFSVPEAELKEWLSDRENTPYPALADALLILCDGKQLTQPVYLDVIVWNYEHGPGGSSPRDIADVDFDLLRTAVVQGYNERYDATAETFESLLR